MADHQRLTELDGDEADALAERAVESEYFDRLEAHLADEHDVTVPTENARAFQRADGVRAVSFEGEEDETDDERRPAVAVTVHFDDGAVVQATAERRGPEVDGTVELGFPAELAPAPEAAVTDLLEADGQSVTVTVDESGDVTTYTIRT